MGATVLESPCIAVAPLPGELRGDSSSGGSSFGDGELSEVSPGKLGPADYELLRVVGQGAFGKVRAAALPCRSLLHLPAKPRLPVNLSFPLLDGL